MKNPYSYYPKVDTTIIEKEDYLDIQLLSMVRKKVKGIYIEGGVLKALRFTNKTEAKMSKFDKMKTITEFINQFHLDVSILLETNKFDVNEKLEIVFKNKKSSYTQFYVSDFQMNQKKYVESLKTK